MADGVIETPDHMKVIMEALVEAEANTNAIEVELSKHSETVMKLHKALESSNTAMEVLAKTANDMYEACK